MAILQVIDNAPRLSQIARILKHKPTTLRKHLLHLKVHPQPCSGLLKTNCRIFVPCFNNLHPKPLLIPSPLRALFPTLILPIPLVRTLSFGYLTREPPIISPFILILLLPTIYHSCICSLAKWLTRI